MNAPARDGRALQGQAYARGRLPAFLGRAGDLAGVVAAVRNHPLVTITGPGGVGKTRLAIELLRGGALSPREVHFVDLAVADQSVDVNGEFARAVGISTAADQFAAALPAYLADRRVLLVVDNCEHVLASCAAVVGALLESSRQLRVLATSREPLGLAVEAVWRLEPLADEQATRLFVERARQLRPNFRPNPETEATIGRLCAALGRLPLAIELTAAQLPVMTPAEILNRIQARMALPSVRRPMAPARHSSVRRAIRWSYELLDPGEQAGFRRLAVFTGGFSAEGATDVALGGSIDLLGQLVGKSLVAATSDDGDHTRYRLLEPIRELALEELMQAGELDDARALHLRHFGAVGEDARAEWLATGTFDRVHAAGRDYENVRAALEWSVDHDPCAGVRLFGAMRQLFFRLGQADGVRLARVLLAACPELDGYRVDALIGLGQLASAVMQHTTAREALAEAASLAQRLEDPVRTAWSTFFQGLAETLAGDPASSRTLLETSLAMHRRLGLESGQARALAVLGVSAFVAGDHPSSRALLEEALRLYEAGNDVWGQGQCLTFLGLITLATAIEPARAAPVFQEACRLLAPRRDATMLPIALVGQATVLAGRDRTTAIKVTAAACSERERVGGRFPPFMTEQIDRMRAIAERLPDRSGLRLWADGARLDVEAAIALAFGSDGPSPGAVGGLSRRELEVVRLLSTGLTNKAIAARLQLSARTVESHVRHALGKLGLENRTQLATWARERLQ